MTQSNQALRALVLSVHAEAEVVKRFCKSKGIELLVTDERDLGFPQLDTHGRGEPSAQLLAAIKKEIANGEFDFIILANNDGAGPPKAELIPKDLRDRTVVMYGSWVSGRERVYVDMGFLRFTTLPNIGAYVERHFKKILVPAEM